MAQEHASTGRVYGDHTPVPYPVYKCKSTAVEKREIKPSTYTHTCKKHVDHEGKHKCICDKEWDPIHAESHV